MRLDLLRCAKRFVMLMLSVSVHRGYIKRVECGDSHFEPREFSCYTSRFFVKTTIGRVDRTLPVVIFGDILGVLL